MSTDIELNSEAKRIAYYRKIAPEVVNTEEFIDYLKRIHFFVAPASADERSAYEGGLFEHNLAVANIFRESVDMFRVTWSRDCTWFIVGMFHSLCLLDDLVVEKGVYKIRKTELKNSKYYGERSLDYLNGHLELTQQEHYCILWHRGSFIGLPEWAEYMGMIQNNPIVHVMSQCNLVISYMFDQ